MLLFAVGCGDGGGIESGDHLLFDACAPLPVVADADLTEARAAGIRAAIALWNERAGTRLTVAVDRGEPGGLPIHFQAAAPNFHGLYDAPNGQVFINTDLAGEALVITIAHEIGHAFGLSHVPAGQYTSVMNPNNLVVEPTLEDVDTLAMRWGVCLASATP
jgi:reprolysin-like metallo-peptidase family M12B